MSRNQPIEVSESDSDVEIVGSCGPDVEIVVRREGSRTGSVEEIRPQGPPQLRVQLLERQTWLWYATVYNAEETPAQNQMRRSAELRRWWGTVYEEENPAAEANEAPNDNPDAN
jgi:hypothetical protein